MRVPLNIAVVTISDTRTTETDTSGTYLCEAISRAGHTLVHRQIVVDERSTIASLFNRLSARKDVDVVISTGGTGLTGRDVTPEALQDVIEKDIPGFGELFRWMSYQKIGTSTIQSRACAGVCNGAFLFALPGSPSACKDAWEGILLAQLNIDNKPCNFAEILPRLSESPHARRKN